MEFSTHTPLALDKSSPFAMVGQYYDIKTEIENISVSMTYLLLSGAAIPKPLQDLKDDLTKKKIILKEKIDTCILTYTPTI